MATSHCRALSDRLSRAPGTGKGVADLACSADSTVPHLRRCGRGGPGWLPALCWCLHSKIGMAGRLVPSISHYSIPQVAWRARAALGTGLPRTQNQVMR